MKPEWVSGNIYIRPNELPNVGDKIEGHTHNFDHTTIVWQGRVRVTFTGADGVERVKEFPARTHFIVLADVKHEIVALEPDTIFWCVYSHRDHQGRITQEYTGWEKAYL